MVYAISKYIFWPLFSLFAKQIKGIKNIPAAPAVFVSNHQTYADGVLLLFMIAWFKNKKVYTFATNEKFKGFFWDLLFNHFGAIRVNGSMAKALKKLKQGSYLAIFPAGGRCYTPTIEEWTHSGLGVLALKYNISIVPVGMNTFTFWSRYRLLPTFKKTIEVNIGRPLKFNGSLTKSNIEKVKNQVKAEVMHLARTSNS